MRASKQRIDPTRLLLRRILLVTLLVIFLAGCLGVNHVYQKQQESVALRSKSEMRLAGLEERQTSLEKDVAELSTDRGREGILRTQYVYGEPGEGVIQIVNGAAPVDQSTSSAPKANWFTKAFPWW